MTKTPPLRIERFNPEVDRRPHLETYRVPLTSDTTVLDGLHAVKAEQDGSLTFRRSCRHAICGSCAMNVDGRKLLVWKTRLGEESAPLHNAETCIMCGACYSACQVVAMGKRYIGPHALLKAFLRVLDPRDAAVAERLRQVGGGGGGGRCHTIFNCIDACPKGLN